MQNRAYALMSPGEYLDREIEREGRHEYVEGQAYALSGGTTYHGKLIMNVAMALAPAAQRRSCHVYSQGVKVKVAARNSYYFPDVIATCEPAREKEDVLSSPCFLAEVLSPSTASIDRREKRAAYATLESLREYVLVYQNRMRVDVYRRTEEGWNLLILREPEQSLEVEGLACSLSLAQIYEGIEFDLRVSEALAEAFDDEWDMDLRPIPAVLLRDDAPAGS